MNQPKKSRDNSGAFWRNRKKKTENHPDYTGEVTVGGQEYWLSGWARESQQGNKYVSLAFKPKAPKPAYVPPQSNAQVRQEREPGSDDDKNGDLPL